MEKALSPPIVSKLLGHPEHHLVAERHKYFKSFFVAEKKRTEVVYFRYSPVWAFTWPVVPLQDTFGIPLFGFPLAFLSGHPPKRRWVQ